MLLMNIREELWRISKFRKRILMMTCILSLIRDQSSAQSLSYLPKRAFPHILEDMNSQTFRLLHTFRETSKCQLPTPPSKSYLKSVSEPYMHLCLQFSGYMTLLQLHVFSYVHQFEKYKRVPKRLSQRKHLVSPKIYARNMNN